MKRILLAILLAAASLSAHAERFAVHLGSFDSPSDAQRWIATLKGVGVPAFTEQSGDKTLLRGGPFDSRDQALAAIGKIKASGLTSAGTPYGALDPEPGSSWKPDDNASYVADLHAKFGKHLHYDSKESMRAIQSFDIDCNATDHRHIPLVNVLLAGLAEVGGRVDYYVQTAQGETRVLEALPSADRGNVTLVINKWGELHSDSAEAIMNMCYGSHGPIWQQAAP